MCDSIVLKSLGNISNKNEQAGDVRIYFILKKHEIFEKIGLDL